MSILDDKTLIKRQYLEGVTIFKTGDEAKEAYLIAKGEVKIYGDEDDIKTEIATLGEGDIFGEMSLIKNKTRSADAVATIRTNLVVISNKTLQEKMEQADPLISALIHMLVQRVYALNKTNILK